MRIGMVSKFGENDGIAIYSDNLVKALRKKVEMVTIGDLNSKSDYKINLKSIFLKKTLETIAKKEGLDALHFQYIAARSYYGLHTLNINLILALNQKIPAIVTLHEVHYAGKTLKEKVIKKLEGTIIKKARKTIVFTETQKEYIQKTYHKQSSVIRMGVTTHPMHKKKGKNILFFGMVSESKGVIHLIKAMDELPGYTLKIAGKIIQPSYAEKLAIGMKRSKNKAISADFGWVSEGKKHEYFENAEIVALPYLQAPYQSAVLHDAVSYGIPVVATKTGPISETVDEFQLGETTSPSDPHALAQAIKKVETNYKKYQEGLEKYRKQAEWGNVAEQHISTYKEAVK